MSNGLISEIISPGWFFEKLVRQSNWLNHFEVECRMVYIMNTVNLAMKLVCVQEGSVLGLISSTLPVTNESQG